MEESKLEQQVNLIKKIDNDNPHMYLCVDFDGVIHDIDYKLYDGYKSFQSVMPDASEYLNKLHNEGWKIVIWTVREESQEMREWLKNNNIPYDSINKHISVIDGQSQKIYADAYLDDRNIECLTHPYPWSYVYSLIQNKFKTFYRYTTEGWKIKRVW